MSTEEFGYCPGCNEKVESDSIHCPHCGQDFMSLEQATTAEVHAITAREGYIGAPIPARDDDDLVGLELADYRVDSLAGRGGMARVYRATHLMLQRPCALKVLSPRLAAVDPTYIDLFLAEARSAASLIHPHVVTVHNVGRVSPGALADILHFIEMELVPGLTLQQIVRREGPLDPLRAAQFMLQVCTGLVEAHKVGLIHRDLKPANILLDDRSSAKLADFGLAKKVVTAGRALGHSEVVGTPYYMAPELFRGKPASARSDVYAVGVTLYYLLSGKLPFVDPTVSRLAQLHALQEIPDLHQIRPDIPDLVVDLIRRCMEKRPADRFAGAASLRDALQTVVSGLRRLTDLVRLAFADRPMEWHGTENHLVLTVPVDDQRRQIVHVELAAEGPLEEHLVKIYSVCAPFHEPYLRRALELNANTTFGSLALQPVDGEPHFVMLNSFPRTTCDPEEVRRSVLEIARSADSVERLLTGRDQF